MGIMRCAGWVVLVCIACNGGSSVPDSGIRDAGPGPEDTAERCRDGKDNDSDGKVDCADPKCAAFTFCVDGGIKADGSKSDGPKSDGPKSDGPNLKSDGPKCDGSILPPSCANCASTDVCINNTCTPTGPAKACGAGPYPAGLSGGVVYVDGSAAPGGNGSLAQPFKKIAEATTLINTWSSANPAPTIIAVAKGKYVEDLVIQRSMQIACRCAEGADGVVIEGGVAAAAPTGTDIRVVLDGCTVQATSFNGKTPAPCGTKSKPWGIGVESAGGVALLVRDSIVQGFCQGLHYNVTDPSSGAPICISRSILRTNSEAIRVTAAPLNISATGHAWGGACQVAGKAISETMAVELSRIENNEAGLVAFSVSEVHLRTSVVRQNTASSSGSTNMAGMGVYLGYPSKAQVVGNTIQQNGGHGIGVVQAKPLVQFAGTFVDIQANQVLANKVAGIQLAALSTETARLANNVIKDTQTDSAQKFGDGVVVTLASGVSSYNTTVLNNTVTSSARNGILMDGVGGSVSGNTVTSSGSYACVLQVSTASVGTNTFSGNTAGNVQTYATQVVPIAGVPIPIP